MPALESMINRGVMGNLATLDPPFSPILWTSIATGMLADKHGILGFTEPMSNQVGVRPVSGYSRKVKAIWNILSQENYKTHVVAWWPSHPAEPINGVMVSNLAQKIDLESGKHTMPEGAVHPKELKVLFSNLRIHPSELTHEHLFPFIPKMESIDQEKDKRLFSVAKILSENSTVQAFATVILENNDWDFAAIYFDGIDHFCHLAMNYHPPKLPWINQNQFDLYKEVVNSAYRFFDMTLQKLLSLTDENTTIMLVSDHGFTSDSKRQPHSPIEPAGPASDHREHGVFIACGPNIKKDNRIYGATLLDITPTILHAFDLPVGEDMDGRVLVEVFNNEKPIKTIDSWEKVDGESGQLPEDIDEDPIMAQEALKQLVDLGYIDKPDENIEKAVKKTIVELDYNLSRVLIASKKYAEALKIIHRLVQDYSNEPRFVQRYAFCLNETGEFVKSKEVLYDLLKKLKEKRLNNNEVKELYAQIKENQKNSKENNEKSHEEGGASINKLKHHHQKLHDILEAELLLIDNEYKMGNTDIALKGMKQLLAEYGEKTAILLNYAGMLLRLKKWEDAYKIYEGVYNDNPNNYAAIHGLGLCLLRLKKETQAIEYLLQAISLQFYNPRAHFHLAQALFGMNEYQQAASALQVVLKMMPGFNIARNLLINIYENHLNEVNKANVLKKFFNSKELSTKELEYDSDLLLVSSKNNLKKSSKNEIVVVSGLPRSGTSLMMQILQASDIEILFDAERIADDSNPKGYYEFERVKNLATDKKWLIDAQGKAVKVVSHLLHFLPQKYNYKIIFMLRDIKEIIASQHELLARHGKASGKTFRADLIVNFTKHLKKTDAFLKTKHNIEVLYVDYNDLLSEPDNTLSELAEFLNISDLSKKAKLVIDPSLYRMKMK